MSIAALTESSAGSDRPHESSDVEAGELVDQPVQRPQDSLEQ